jgi:hypothetical protein
MINRRDGETRRKKSKTKMSVGMRQQQQLSRRRRNKQQVQHMISHVEDVRLEEQTTRKRTT